jgi:hypothetical protein
MPLSHDSKPRKKPRRQKYQKEREKRGNVVKLSPRQAFRRKLRENFLEVCKAQRELEQALRAVGISWRKLEKAVHALADGRWAKVDPAFLKAFLAAEGVHFEQEKTA